MNPDMTGTDTTSTDTTSTGSAVTITEIAEFLRQLRTLSGSPGSSAITGTGPGRDTTAERAALLTRKADLLARIAAAHPDLIPAPTTRPGEGSA